MSTRIAQLFSDFINYRIHSQHELWAAYLTESLHSQLIRFIVHLIGTVPLTCVEGKSRFPSS